MSSLRRVEETKSRFVRMYASLPWFCVQLYLYAENCVNATAATVMVMMGTITIMAIIEKTMGTITMTMMVMIAITIVTATILTMIMMVITPTIMPLSMNMTTTTSRNWRGQWLQGLLDALPIILSVRGRFQGQWVGRWSVVRCHAQWTRTPQPATKNGKQKTVWKACFTGIHTLQVG